MQRPHASESTPRRPIRRSISVGHAQGQPMFGRRFKRLSAACVERALLYHQRQVLGAPPANELIVLDGKVPAHSVGLNVVSAVTSPTQCFWAAKWLRKKPTRSRPPAHCASDSI